MAVLEAMEAAVLLADGEERILYRNAAARRWFAGGQTLAEALGVTLAANGQDTDPAGTCQGQRHLPEASITVAGGRTILADVRVASVSTCPDGPRFACFVTDVSDAVSQRRRLEFNERLIASGRLAAEVVHELGNPLDGVLRHVGLAMRGEGEEVGEHLQRAREGLMRMVGVLREYSLEYAGRGGVPCEPIGQLLCEAIEVMAPTSDRLGVTVHVQASPEARQCPADGRLFQVFCNVIRNALDAMPEGGQLTVFLQREENDVLVIDVLDTGVGIGEGEDEAVFLPFYTTKPPGQGAGLGLAVCREILARLGGLISASRRREGGTIVTICLPTSHVDRAERQEESMR
jgi:signal transduction histidine kinase